MSIRRCCRCRRDLQEDKEAIFDSFDTVELCLELAAPLVVGASLNREGIAAKLDQGHLDATTLMEYLILRDIPQRTAHHLIGDLVRRASEKGVRLADLSLAEFQAADPSLDKSVYECLGVDNVVASFRSYGSTAPAEVRKQIEIWKKKLK